MPGFRLEYFLAGRECDLRRSCIRLRTWIVTVKVHWHRVRSQKASNQIFLFRTVFWNINKTEMWCCWVDSKMPHMLTRKKCGAEMWVRVALAVQIAECLSFNHHSIKSEIYFHSFMLFLSSVDALAPDVERKTLSRLRRLFKRFLLFQQSIF